MYKHEREHCRERKRQMQGPVDSLTAEGAVSWYGELNVTKTTFNSMLDLMSLKMGPNFLQKGVKVRNEFIRFIL